VVSRSTVSKSFCWWVEAIGKILSIGLRHRPWLPIASVMRRTPAANYSAEAPSDVNDFTLIPLFGRYFAAMTALPTQKMPFSVNRLLTASVQNQFKCGAGRMYARLPQMARSGNHFGPLLFQGTPEASPGSGPDRRPARPMIPRQAIMLISGHPKPAVVLRLQ
jgi:hypothetical protein